MLKQDEGSKMSDTKTPQFFLLVTPDSVEFSNLRGLITTSLDKYGIKPILLEETPQPGYPTAASRKKAIELADIVIVDVTENNPNVMYEAGFANALGKSVLPIVQRKAKRVPADISGQFYLVYDPSNLAQLSDNIETWASRYLESTRKSS